MNLFSRILALFGVGGLANPSTGAQHSGPTTRSSESGVVVGDDRAMAVSAVWSCVRLIAETVGSLPLHTFERAGDERRRIDDSNHYLNTLLRWRPNQEMSGLEFREAMTTQLALWGNAYAAIDRLDDGTPARLTPLRPEHVTPVRDETGLRYEYSTSKGVVVFGAPSVLHLKGFGTEGIIGLSPLAYARQSLGLSVSADLYAAKSFKDGGRPDGVLRYDKFLTDQQRKKLREVYGNVGAIGEDGRMMILELGLEFQPISIPPDQLQMLASRQFQIGEIARYFRVPLHLIMDTTGSTSWGTGIEQLTLGFLIYTLRPYLRRWESAVSDKLVPTADRGRVFVEHQVEGLLRADAKTRSEFWSRMAQNGLMTRNEIRQRENLPRIDGADALTVQTNLTPVDQLEAVNQ